VTHTSHADGDPGGVAPADLPHLRRCVELAAEAVDAGDHPFGSVLVAAGGRVLAEDRNRENTMGDATRHPEFELARWAAANLTAADRAAATVFTSGEHCPMCAAAHIGQCSPEVKTVAAARSAAVRLAAAQRASSNSGCLVASPMVFSRLRSSARTRPPAATSTEPKG